MEDIKFWEKVVGKK